MPTPSLLQRLKERKLVQWAFAYLAGAWALMELVGFLREQFDWPAIVGQTVTVIAAFGFFITLVLAWYHGEKGRQRVSGPELLMVAALLVIAGGVLTILPGEDRVTGPDEAASVPGLDDDRPAIAVLPFDDFSPDPDAAYFASGIHEEITSKLSRISALKVISRSSVMQYREERPPTPQIADDLGVDFILEGSARIAGNQVRLTAQLIDAARDEHLWSEEFDRELSIENLLDIQIEIASQIAAELEATITHEEQQRVSARPTDNLEAYEQYLRGRMFSSEHTPEGLRRGMESFERAIALDSTFALAYVGLAWCHRELTRVYSATAGEGYEKTTDALTRAIELDANLGEAYAWLGSTRFVADWDTLSPEPLFRRALQLNPGSAEVYRLYSHYLVWMGQDQKAIEMAMRLVELDPLSLMTNQFAGIAHFYANRYDESIAWLRKARELDPTNAWPHIYLAWNYTMKGDSAAAITHADRVDAFSRATGDPTLVAYVGLIYGRWGWRQKAEAILSQTLDLYANGSIGAIDVANIYVGLGDNDSAFEWLRRAVEEHGGTVVYLKAAWGKTIHRDLRSDPRYDEILRMAGF